MIFAVVMFLATLALALSAGYLSVMGFAMTFQNTFWQAFALAASLEVGKLVAASFLYRYWSSIQRSMRVGMTIAVFGLMLFTSAGIYGYLSASYQESSVGLNVNTQRVAMLEEERTRSITRKAEIDKQISDLPVRFVSARQKLMKSFGPEVDRLNQRIADIDAEMLTLKQQTVKDESHVGPVIFIAKTLGMDSDAAVAWFILLVVLVFDPLAVMMTLGTNHVMMEAKRRKSTPEVSPGETPSNPTPGPLNPSDEDDRLKPIEEGLRDLTDVIRTSSTRDQLKRDLLTRK